MWTERNENLNTTTDQPPPSPQYWFLCDILWAWKIIDIFLKDLGDKHLLEPNADSE